MKPNDTVHALNRILADHFGLNPYGEPRFKWMHCNDLVMPVPVMGLHPAYGDWRPVEGGRILVRDAPWKFLSYNNGSYVNQWVICRWDLFTPDQWYSMANTHEGFPQRGFYSPGEWCTAPSQYPTFKDTLDFIYQAKKRLTKTPQQWRAEEEAKIEKQKRRRRERTSGMVRERLTSFPLGKPVPGHGESVPFAEVFRKGKEEHAQARS